MASVNTNAAALTALRTLQATNSQLEMTQARISTGYKIGEAKDNAAYWAISTTLKSDNKSLSTVKDALGLGAATVDTAYQGLNKAKDVLDEIKSKLTAATQNGVNRDTIQAEIKQLQDQLKSIASSSVFSGENWLSIDSSATAYSSNKSVVASFSRDATGSVSIGTISVDASQVALFDANADVTKAGIVDAKADLVSSTGKQLAYGGTNTTAVGNSSSAGLVKGSGTGVTAAALTGNGVIATKGEGAFTGTFASTVIAGSDKVTFTFDLKGINPSTGAQTTTAKTLDIVTGDVTAVGNGDTTVNSVGELVAAFNHAAAAVPDTTYEAYSDGGVFKIRSTTTGDSSGIKLTAITPTGSATAMGLSPVDTNIHMGVGGAKATTSNLDISGLATTDKIQFSFKFDGGATQTYNVARGADLAALVSNLNGASGFSSYAVASVSGTDIVFTGKSLGADKTISLTGVTYTDSSDVSKELATATNMPYSTKAKVVNAAFTGPITLDADDKIQFDLTVNGGASKLVTIDKATIDSVISGGLGTINTAANYATVLNKALSNAGFTNVTASVGTIGSDAGKVLFTTTDRGSATSINIGEVSATKGAKQISVDAMDISSSSMTALGADTDDKVREVITAYISVVNSAINKVTSAAASLGSVASRVDLQKTFVNTLMDTIDKGVGNLIDADMTEESTKLQALQVKQQLGTQALSIANQSAQGVLSLFRS